MTKQDAFIIGYMDKEAAVPGAATASSLASQGIKAVFEKAPQLAAAIAAGAPLAIGAGAGHLISAATSPTEADQEALQRQIHDLELQEFEAELRRRKAIEEKERKEKEADVAPRSLRL